MSDELISKQAVLDALLAKMDEIDDKPEVVLGMAVAMGMIKAMPPVMPAEKVGRWIMHIDDLFPAESTMECDQCHEHQPITIDDNYCPNCGAKMEGDINVQRRSNKNH